MLDFEPWANGCDYFGLVGTNCAWVEPTLKYCGHNTRCHWFIDA